MVYLAKVVHFGEFFNFTEIIGQPNKATSWNEPQLCSVNEVKTLRMHQVLLTNEVTSMRLSQWASLA